MTQEDYQQTKFTGGYIGGAISITELKSKSLKGINFLVKRQIVIRLFSFLANIILARLLVPEVFGVYAIVAFVVQVFSMFGDVGIGAALIQKKEELSREKLSSIFWLQQILVWFVVCVAFVVAPLVLIFYHTLPSYATWLIRIMAVSFALASLKTIPAILMERELDFSRIALVDIMETAIFYVTAIFLAIAGFEVWSFIIAALLRSFGGVITIYMCSPWRPACFFKISEVKDLVHFGFAYQGSGLINLIKDSVTPIFIGVYAGSAAVGYVTWAKMLALSPLMLSEAFGRVAFPAFSRMQSDKEVLSKAVERSMKNITMVMFPVVALMFALGPEIVHVVFTEKWLPALPAYYFYCSVPLAIGVMLPMYSAILSLGRSGIILKMSMGLLVLEWGLGVPLVWAFDFNGVAFSQPLIAALFYFVYRRVLRRNSVRPELLRNIRPQLVSFAATFGAVVMIKQSFTVSPAGLSIAALSGIAVYVAVVFFVGRQSLTQFMKDFIELFRSGK